MSKVRRIKFLTREQERALCLARDAGDPTAVNTMVESILPLAVRQAKRYRGRGVDFEDLVQEANVAAMRAAQNLDADKGRLTTYAVHCMRTSLWNKIKTDGVVRTPGTLNNPANIEKANQAKSHMLSLSTDFLLVERLAEPEPEPRDDISRERELFDAAVVLLPSSYATVMRGLICGKAVKEMAVAMGVSSQRVFEIRKRAIGLIREFAVKLQRDHAVEVRRRIA